MVNSGDFVYRVTKVMEYYNLSSSAFADRIKVQRSSISHLLSGRNKPSLDFVLKVVKEFDTVDLYWLLNGKGVFPKDGILASPAESNIKKENSTTEKKVLVDSEIVIPGNKKIERIVLFYSDGTFREYVQ